MRKLAMFLLFAFWAVPAFAQCPVWSRTYGGSQFEYGWSVQQTTDGGYIVTGEVESFGAGNSNVYLIKTNSTGDTLWSRTYGGSARDVGRSVQQTTDGGYIVAGFTLSFGADDYFDVYLIKTDSIGDTLWTRTYRGSNHDLAWSVQQTTDGGYIVCGETYSFGAGLNDIYLIKTDSDGDTLWTRTYGTDSYEHGTSVQQTTDGGYIVTGWTYVYPYNDLYLIRTDFNGNTLWTRTYGGSEDDQGYSVQQTTDGGYIVAGTTDSFGAGGFDVWLIKTNSTGGIQWSRTYGGSDWDGANSVQQTTDGGYIVTGYTYSFGARDVYLIKTNSSGDTLWTRIYGGGDDEGVSVQQTADGGYVVAGRTSTFGAGNYDVMLTKLDSRGNTCIGGFVSSTVTSVSPTVTSPATVVTSPSPMVITPTDTVTSPATQVTTVCAAIRGDVNADGKITAADVVYLINYLFISGPAPDPLWVGNCNCDGVINSADVVYLINYLFIGGPPPCC
jgi:hypothetical protein